MENTAIYFNSLSFNKPLFKTFILSTLFQVSYGNSSPLYESPPGYDFSGPERIILKNDLLEISGITFLKERVGNILNCCYSNIHFY